MNLDMLLIRSQFSHNSVPTVHVHCDKILVYNTCTYNTCTCTHVYQAKVCSMSNVECVSCVYSVYHVCIVCIVCIMCVMCVSCVYSVYHVDHQ